MILHIDINAYFATLEQQANPFLRGRPILVCGKGSGERTVVATASYEAKRLGVKTGMAVWQAKKLVPEALIIAADYDKYLDVTRRLGQIFEQYTPDVEFFSIDEAFLKISAGPVEVTPLGAARSLQRLPRSDSASLSFASLRNQARGASIRSLGVFTSPPALTQNIAAAIKCAEQIKRDIKRELGEWVTCSIGIAENKLLAKIASEFRKPDGLVVVIPENHVNTDVSRFSHTGCVFLETHRELWEQIKLEDIPGIGPRILRRLLKLGINFPHILRETPLPILVKEFGKHQGSVLYNLGRGIDPSPVVRNELMPEEKSFSHSYTLPKEIYTYPDARKVLLELCEMVGRRMRKKGFAGRTIGVFMRFTDMTACSERKTFKEYTNDGLQIFRVGEWLLQKTWAFKYKLKPIRQVGIWVTNLIHEQNLPLPLFEEDKRVLRAIQAADQINDKHGEFTLMRAPVLEVYQKVQKIPDGRNKRAFVI